MDIYQAAEREKEIKARRQFIEDNPGLPLTVYAAKFKVVESTIRKDILTLHKKYGTYYKYMKFETWIKTPGL